MQPPRKKLKPNPSPPPQQQHQPSVKQPTPGYSHSQQTSPGNSINASIKATALPNSDNLSVSTSGGGSKSTVIHTSRKNPKFDKHGNDVNKGTKYGDIRISLKEAYSGTTKKVRLRRKVVCPMCKGVIRKEKKIVDCQKCKGKGKTVAFKPIGPKQTKRIEVRCMYCLMTGKVNVNCCRNCSNRGVVSEKFGLQIKINKGWPNAQSVLIPLEGGYSGPGLPPGDVKINVYTKPYHRFSVRGKDLLVYREIQLSEALTGVSLHIKHLDSRILKAKSVPGVIIAPGSVYKIRGEGMPKLNPNLPNGDLFPHG